MNLQQQRDLLKRRLLEDRRKTVSSIVKDMAQERRAPLRNAMITDWINKFTKARTGADGEPAKQRTILSCSSSVCPRTIRSKKSRA